MKNLCKCKGKKLIFKKYTFERGEPAYRGTCVNCGLTRNWFSAKNYRIVTGNSPNKKGGDNKI